MRFYTIIFGDCLRIFRRFLQTFSTVNSHYKLTIEERNALPESEFGIPKLKMYPMPDAEHVRSAENYFHVAPENRKTELARNIIAKAEIYGVHISNQIITDWAER